MKQKNSSILCYILIFYFLAVHPQITAGHTSFFKSIDYFSIPFSSEDSTNLAFSLDVDCKVNQEVSIAGGSDGIASVEIKDGVAPYQVSLMGPRLENIQSLNGLINFSDLSAGDYTVKITDANDVLDSCSFSVIEPIICDFFITINPIPATCFNANDGKISLSFTDGEEPFDITWSNPSYNGFSNITNLAAIDYGVTVTDSRGCSDTVGVVITQPEQLTPKIIPSNAFVCEGETITLSIEEDKYTAYEWSNSDQNSSTPIGGGGMYQLTVTDDNGCQGVDTIFIDEIEQDTFRETLFTCSSENLGTFFIERRGSNGCMYVIHRTLELAEIDTILIKNTTCNPKKAGTFKTSIVNQFGCNNIRVEIVELLSSDTTFLTETTCFTQDTGWTSISLVNQLGCDSIIKKRIELDESSECLIGYTVLADTICSNEIDGSIKLLGTYGEPPFDYFLIDTTNNNRDTIEIGVIVNLNEEIILDNIPSGIYLIELLQESTNARLARSVEIVRNQPIDIQATLSDYNGFAISCKDAMDGSITLAIEGGQAPYTYLWESSETTKDIQSLPKGTYQVTVNDALNCMNSATFNVHENEPLVNFVSERPRCSDENLGQLTISEVFNVDGKITYSVDGILYDVIDKFPFVINELAVGDYQLFIQYDNDCLLDTTFLIPEANQLNLLIEKDLELVLGDSLFITPSANFKIARMEWSSEPVQSCVDCSSLAIRPTKSGKYFLTAYDVFGCSAAVSTNIRLETKRQIFIPNIFSPNNDGINDTYQVFMGNSVAKLNSLRIFDVNGQLVYNVNNLPVSTESIGWNGEFNGRKMPAGVFVVMIEISLIDGTSQSYAESLNLIY